VEIELFEAEIRVNLDMLSSATMARSSLEEMLDSLRRRDEVKKPKDLPPTLLARPTSRARLPSARRSLPNNFRVSGDGGGGDGDGGSPPLCEFNGKEEGKMSAATRYPSTSPPSQTSTRSRI
jgi:hypothetical protein